MSILKRIFATPRTIAANKHYFLITSSGQMGTFWLAAQLNKHPKIFCTHAYDKPVWGAHGSPLKGRDGERQRENIKKYFHKLSLKQFFAEHEVETDKPIIGNAHAYNIDRALEMVKQEKLKHIKIINLIRHPISRINSAVNCIKNEWLEGYIDHLNFVPKMYLSHGRPLVKELFNERLDEFDDSLLKQFFIVSTMHERGSAYHANLAAKNNVLNVRYEDITTDPQTMERVINYICDTEGSGPWVAQHVSYKKVNAHSGQVNDTIQDVFNRWEPWQQVFYRHIINTDDHFKFYKQSGFYQTL